MCKKALRKECNAIHTAIIHIRAFSVASTSCEVTQCRGRVRGLLYSCKGVEKTHYCNCYTVRLHTKLIHVSYVVVCYRIILRVAWQRKGGWWNSSTHNNCILRFLYTTLLFLHRTLSLFARSTR